MMLRRSGSVLCVRSWRTCLRMSKVNVTDREVLREMPSIRIIPNQCVEYNIVFDCAFIINLIIKSRYVVYVELVEGIHLITFFSYMMSSMGAMECPLSIRCANFDFQFLYLRSRKFFEILCEMACRFVPYIFLLQS